MTTPAPSLYLAAELSLADPDAGWAADGGDDNRARAKSAAGETVTARRYPDDRFRVTRAPVRVRGVVRPFVWRGR